VPLSVIDAIRVCLVAIETLFEKTETLEAERQTARR
jgi:hypothetical protein